MVEISSPVIVALLVYGALLVGAFGHGGERGIRVDEVAQFVERAHATGIDVAVTDAVTWARGRAKSLSLRDFAVLAVARES